MLDKGKLRNLHKNISIIFFSYAFHLQGGRPVNRESLEYFVECATREISGGNRKPFVLRQICRSVLESDSAAVSDYYPEGRDGVKPIFKDLISFSICLLVNYEPGTTPNMLIYILCLDEPSSTTSTITTSTTSTTTKGTTSSTTEDTTSTTLKNTFPPPLKALLSLPLKALLTFRLKTLLP